MKIYVKGYDRKTMNNIELWDDEKYKLCVSEKGELFAVSRTEKDEDGWDKQLDIIFKIVAE